MNINDQNNRGFLALKLNRAAGKKDLNASKIAKEIDLSLPTISAVLRGGHASMESYKKVAEYLGVPMKPEKSLVTNKVMGPAELEEWDKKHDRNIEELPGKKLTKEDIVEREGKLRLEIAALKAEREQIKKDFMGRRPIIENTLPAPIVQDEFTRWQAWVIMALQVVVILFLIFPTR